MLGGLQFRRGLPFHKRLNHYFLSAFSCLPVILPTCHKSLFFDPNHGDIIILSCLVNVSEAGSTWHRCVSLLASEFLTKYFHIVSKYRIYCLPVLWLGSHTRDLWTALPHLQGCSNSPYSSHVNGMLFYYCMARFSFSPILPFIPHYFSPSFIELKSRRQLCISENHSMESDNIYIFLSRLYSPPTLILPCCLYFYLIMLNLRRALKFL